MKQFFFVCCMVLMLLWASQGMVQAEGEKPVVMLAGFESRVSSSKVTLTTLQVNQQELLNNFVDILSTELANDERYNFYDTDATVTRARMDETSLIHTLGDGQIVPSLQNQADYIVYGYLTNLSEIKAQIGALGLNGKDKTIHIELSMRVVDAHTGAVVFVTTADSRRKSQLTYHAILNRHDVGQENAVSEALNIAAQNLAGQFKAAI